MIRSKNINQPTNSYLIFFSIFFFCLQTNLFAQIKDTSTLLLASAKTKTAPFYFIQQPNVIFPEILKGNEANSSDYVASFSNKKRNYLVHLFTKGKKILPKVKAILKKNNLPEELGVLMLLESACDANAISKAGAVGYWQIMDVVAKEYGLNYVPRLCAEEKKKLNHLDAKKTAIFFKTRAKQKDDRKNFSKSTLTAARYLQDNCSNLNNNWLLVVASYNCGIGNIRKAMKRSGKINPGFWDIKKFLPAETQAYVMNFITLNVIYHNYEKFYTNNLNFTTVKILIPDNFEPIQTEETELSTNDASLQR